MSELRKANTSSPYFITMTVVKWIDVFTRKELAQIVIDNLNYCSENKGLIIYEYVIMPSHIHMICQAEEDKKLSDILRDFKSFTAKQIYKEIEKNSYESRKDWLIHLFQFEAKFKKQHKLFQFWQKTNHPTELDYNQIFDQKAEYIRQNPVKAKLVNAPENYIYSSANPDSPVKFQEP